MSTYTISDTEVSSIHNAVCYLRNAIDSAKSTLRDDSDIVRSLERAMSTIEPLRKRVMDEQDAAMDNQMDYFGEVQKENGFHSIWSIYNQGIYFNQKHNLPVGALFTCYDVPEPDNRFKVEGNTWLDVWKTVDKYLEYYSDYVGDHIFIERFTVKDDRVYIVLGS
jgi:hypothetical protein